jgi:RNA polymerase sigma factor (sigma-70 family)
MSTSIPFLGRILPYAADRSFRPCVDSALGLGCGRTDNQRSHPMPPRRTILEIDRFESRLEAAKAGESWAWEEIYANLAGPVTGYLRSRGALDPEDIGSEVFFQVARDIHRFEGDESKFRSWVFVIAHRRLIDARRADSRRVSTVDEALDHETEGGDVEEEVMEQLALTRMREIFDSLTEDQKRVLALRIIGDLTLEETARVLGKRVGAVKALQRRALAAVKASLDQGRVSL